MSPVPPRSVDGAAGVGTGVAKLGSGAGGLTATIGVGAGRGAAGFAAGLAAGFAAFFAFLAGFAFFRGAARFLAARLAVLFGARRATARFFALDFFLAFLFFLAMSSTPRAGLDARSICIIGEALPRLGCVTAA